MEWKNAIKDYQNYLKIERGLSQNTIDSYTRDLEKLTLFLKQNELNISPLLIGKTIVQRFIYEIATHVNPRSQARIISGLRSF
jgi:integrase/recombinase XerD